MLTLTEAKKSAIGRQLTQHLGYASHGTYMAAYMLTEAMRGKESAWWPYLQSLPTSTAHLASVWSDEELQWLQGTSAYIKARDQQRVMRGTYEKLRTLPSFTFSYEAFAHAVRLVESRCFGYDTLQENECVALVPLLDIINHAASDTCNTRWKYDRQTRLFTLRATATLPAHQPLVTSYGDRSNSQLLTGYGFVLEDSRWDEVRVQYERVGVDGVVAEATVMLRAEDGGSRSQLLVDSVRRLAVRDVAAVQIKRKRQDKQRSTRVLVERRVLQRIAGAVKQADGRYGGDRASEAARLNAWSGAKGKEWQALEVRAGERRVLQWWLDVCALGKRWLADGVRVGELWQRERAEMRRLKVRRLRDAWVAVLEDEKVEETKLKTEEVTSRVVKRQRVGSN